MSSRGKVLAALSVAEMLAMALWFSASAVVPQLTAEWGLNAGAQSWLTMSVQLGFVVGTLLSAILNLPDRVAAERLVAVSALLGAGFNATIAMLPEGSPDVLGMALGLRFLTGMTLAGVYPPGMKLMASWFRRGRGMAIGVLVGAITVGSAAPHLLNAVRWFGGEAGLPPWRAVLLASSGSAVAGAVIVAAFVHAGPLLPAATRFHWRHAAFGMRDPATRLANLGYLAHMWELYAMWAWVPLLLLDAFRDGGSSETAARVTGFAVVAVGGVGSVVAGLLADRWGRTRVAIASLVASGSCALVAGFLYDMPAALAGVCLIWGFAVVADSAQFSAAVSELTEGAFVGTALTMQTCMGFLLTMASIRLVPVLVARFGWGPSLAVLAIGPALGIVAMTRLRTRPESVRMASGNR